MDDQLSSMHFNESKDNESDKTSKIQYLSVIASKSNDEAANQTGSLPKVNSLSEQISTDDTELSSAVASVKVLSKKTKGSPAAYDAQINSKAGSTSAGSIHNPQSVETDQPRPLHILLPSAAENHTLPEASQPFTSTKGQGRLKTTTHSEADGSDICAAVLLHCLFCHPLDCLLETFRGCNVCIWSLCSSVCGCEPTTLYPLLNVTQSCDLCGCLGVRRFLCDCSICDICLPVTECLDLAMEISQMLYH